MKKNSSVVVKQFVDFLAPELTPYEVSLYLLLLRLTFIQDGGFEVRIGKRTLAKKIGKGARVKEKVSYRQISKTVKGLEKKGCIRVSDTNREGTLYIVVLPEEIPLVAGKLALVKPKKQEDYFTDPEKRREVFERDNWICFYCGEKVNEKNATLDHYIPQHLGGENSKSNLKTCCLLCNSIKSGKMYEEAAPFLLKNMKERKKRKRSI